MTYSPLVVGETEDYLEVNNCLVGTYVYKLILKCLPAKEKDLEFTTELGNMIPIRLRVQNRTEAKTEFQTCVSMNFCVLEVEIDYSLVYKIKLGCFRALFNYFS